MLIFCTSGNRCIVFTLSYIFVYNIVTVHVTEWRVDFERTQTVISVELIQLWSHRTQCFRELAS